MDYPIAISLPAALVKMGYPLAQVAERNKRFKDQAAIKGVDGPDQIVSQGHPHRNQTAPILSPLPGRASPSSWGET